MRPGGAWASCGVHRGDACCRPMCLPAATDIPATPPARRGPPLWTQVFARWGQPGMSLWTTASSPVEGTGATPPTPYATCPHLCALPVDRESPALAVPDGRPRRPDDAIGASAESHRVNRDGVEDLRDVMHAVRPTWSARRTQRPQPKGRHASRTADMVSTQDATPPAPGTSCEPYGRHGQNAGRNAPSPRDVMRAVRPTWSERMTQGPQPKGRHASRTPDLAGPVGPGPATPSTAALTGLGTPPARHLRGGAGPAGRARGN